MNNEPKRPKKNQSYGVATSSKHNQKGKEISKKQNEKRKDKDKGKEKIKNKEHKNKVKDKIDIEKHVLKKKIEMIETKIEKTKIEKTKIEKTKRKKEEEKSKYIAVEKQKSESERKKQKDKFRKEDKKERLKKKEQEKLEAKKKITKSVPTLILRRLKPSSPDKESDSDSMVEDQPNTGPPPTLQPQAEIIKKKKYKKSKDEDKEAKKLKRKHGVGEELERGKTPSPANNNEKNDEAVPSTSFSGIESHTRFTNHYRSQLYDLQYKIMALEDIARLQQVVQVISEERDFTVSQSSYDLDLCSLGPETVKRLQDMFYKFQLIDLGKKILALEDYAHLQQVIQVLSKERGFIDTPSSYEIDLGMLGPETVKRLQDMFSTFE